MRDKLHLFGDNIDATGAAGDTDSTDTLDLEKVDKGEGTVLWWVVRLREDFAGGTSCQFILADSPNDSTWRERIQTDAIVLAALLEGLEIKIGIHYDTQRYLKVIARTLGTFTGTDRFHSWIEID